MTLIASLERMQPDHAARKAEAAALDVSTLPQQLGGKGKAITVYIVVLYICILTVVFVSLVAGHFVVSKKFSQEPIQLLKAKPKAAEKTEEKKPVRVVFVLLFVRRSRSRTLSHNHTGRRAAAQVAAAVDSSVR